MNEIVDMNKCSGCTACYNICPKGAIKMEKNSEGFFYPVVDQEKCIKCGLCKKVCPVNNNHEKEKEITAYACFNKNKEIRLDSSSGGIFNLIAEYILDDNGIVFGAAFDEDYLVKHIYIDNKKDLEKLRKSKYLQSSLNDIFKSVKNFLKEDKKVLFTGTPCQIEGLKLFLQKNYDNLYTQDIVCHGVPSPKLWQKYLESKDEKIKDVNFRNKDNGWEDFNLKINDYAKHHQKDQYMRLFLSNLALRKSCYNCSSKKIYRVSDITLADFWGIDNVLPAFNDHFGTSLVVINSLKGKELFDSIKESLEYKEVDFMESIKENSAYNHSCKMPKGRLTIFNDLDKMDFDSIYKKYNLKKISFKKIISKMMPKQLKQKIKKILKK